MKYPVFFLIFLLILTQTQAQNESAAKSKTLLPDYLFANALNQKWKISMQDDCKSDWSNLWFKDGENSTVKNSENGMDIYAGNFDKPIGKENQADHTVLWTKQSFKGDIRIDFDYMRLDSVNRFVAIVYICAEGSGKTPYDKDIYKWRNLRKVPAMKEYYNHMNAYHISFSAYNNDGNSLKDYIRARQYIPEKSGLKGTELNNEYYNTGFFQTGIKHHITVISYQDHIFMRVTSPEKSTIFYWNKNTKNPLISGRVGLRLMYYRGANFKNIKIYTLK